MNSRKFKCIIFDCDGVLVDSEVISNTVLVDMANTFGAKLNYDEALEMFRGKSMNLCLEIIEARIQSPLPNDFEEKYRAQTALAFEKDIKAVDGVKTLVEQLKVPFCVASSGPEHKIKLNLSLTGLISHFENKMFSCYGIQKWKPDPGVFIWAAETMGFNIDECVVVEDTLTGVTAAKNGGFFTIGYSERDVNNTLISKADVTFETMAEVQKFLNNHT